MRTLVVGAGAIGGYFGGRLLEIKRDVTFMARSRRAEELRRSGLRIHSRFGDAFFPNPAVVQADSLRDTFDLVLVTTKSYDLEAAITDFAPAVGSNTAIIPLLNGIRHLEMLDRRFGTERVLGGQCLIASSVNAQGEIAHLNDTHELSFGERDGSLSSRVQKIAELMQGARFDARTSTQIMQEMWEKWVFLSSAAGSGCLMRGTVGDINAAPGGTEFVLSLIDECREIAASQGYVVRDASFERTRAMLTAGGSTLTPSMLRDIERGARIEADHIIGDLLRRAKPGTALRLATSYTHLKAYEARRQRETKSA